MSYELSTNKNSSAAVVAALEALAEAKSGVESVAHGIRDHSETFYIKPTARSYAQGAEIFTMAAEEEKQVNTVSKTFRYRPWDGAYATAATLFEIYGYAGFGKATATMFGTVPPQKISIQVSPDETVEVPWGELQVPDLKAVLTLGSTYDREYGTVFQLSVTAPKKMETAIKGLFVAIENTLKTKSIYKGKAINGAEMPEFIDPFSVKREKVIYTRAVEQQLTGLLWNPIRHTDRARERGISLKRSVLLAGPYGTGKSLTGMLTAQEAVSNGWTYILCRPGKDNLDEVMQTARLYQPAVVFYEDVDVLASTDDQTQVQKLLDLFDGITSKGTEIIVVLTTNQLDRIHKGMMRPGRMDGIIKIEGLDADGCARMVLAMSEDRLADGVQLLQVGQALEEYEPAFVAEAIKRADLFNLDKDNVQLVTEDFLGSAESLRYQWAQYNDAREAKPAPDMDRVLKSAINTALVETIATGEVKIERDGETFASLTVTK